MELTAKAAEMEEQAQKERSQPRVAARSPS
jgi:hypothetical protein